MPSHRDETIREILAATRTVAVVGAHPELHRAAHYVPAYLRSVGYRVLPVNPAFVGTELFGEPVVARLTELDTPVDLVDVFRRSSRVPSHIADILTMDPAPTVVWLQLGIRHDEAARELEAAGIVVVQDRCTLADHRRLFSADVLG